VNTSAALRAAAAANAAERAGRRSIQARCLAR